MLRFNFTGFFRARGISKPFTYLVKHGYSANFSTRLIHGRMERLNLSDVEKLCEFFQCTPNDMLEWIPGKGVTNVEKHPLYPLKRAEQVENITQLLSSLPFSKLSEIENLIRKEIDNG